MIFFFVITIWPSLFFKRQRTSTKPGKDLPSLMVLCLLFEFKARLRVHLHMARFHEEKEDIVKTKLNLSIITRIKLNININKRFAELQRKPSSTSLSIFFYKQWMHLNAFLLYTQDYKFQALLSCIIFHDL